MKFYDAWWFIHNHPMNMADHGLNFGLYDLDIFVPKVDPGTNTISNDGTKNTKIRVWLEYGPYENVSYDDVPHWVRTHDPNLDCGADTFEEAIIKLAGLIKEFYGTASVEDDIEDWENDQA